MANKDFYEELDLRYPELAICLDKIDRTNPGKRRFYIPILTPNLDTTSLRAKTETIHQTNDIIANKESVNIDNVSIQNYIEITIPKELCAFVGGDFHVKNVGSMNVEANGRNGITNTGAVGVWYHTRINSTGRFSFRGIQTLYKGILNIIPTDPYRYIDPGSKWIVVFIGGDIGKPQLIGRYTDPEPME